MKLLLRRESPYGVLTDCTLGILTVGDLKLSTIERPWIPAKVGKGGEKGVSCVPPGTYKLVKHSTEAHPQTWALVNHELDVYHQPGKDVPPWARTAVLIHVANYVHELRGCIAPGLYTAKSEDSYMVCQSRKAMHLLQEAIPWVSHELEIQ